MEMLQLQLFASVARTLNFSRTAAEFSITQPAVSHQIKKLEAQLDIRLIKRSSHDVALTPEGLEFLAYAAQILELSATAENRMQNIAQGRVGRIRIAVLSSTSSQLCDCLIELYRRSPWLQVDIDLLEGTELISSIQRQKHDFYFAVEPMIPKDNRYQCRVIHQDQLMLFVNKSIADTIDLSDWSTVQAQPFVAVTHSDSVLSGQVAQICRHRGCTPRIINYYNRAESVVLSVNSGIGVAILPGELQHLYQRPNVVTLPIDGGDTKIRAVFAWRRDEESPACRVFRDIVFSIYPRPDGC